MQGQGQGQGVILLVSQRKGGQSRACRVVDRMLCASY